MRLDSWYLHVEVAKVAGQFVVRSNYGQSENPSSGSGDRTDVLQNVEELQQWLARQAIYLK